MKPWQLRWGGTSVLGLGFGLSLKLWKSRQPAPAEADKPEKILRNSNVEWMAFHTDRGVKWVTINTRDKNWLSTPSAESEYHDKSMADHVGGRSTAEP